MIETEIESNGEVTSRVVLKKPAGIKIKPKLKISFTNGLSRNYEEARGFGIEIEGSYEKCLALLDEMRKTIVGFKEADEDGK